MRMNKSCIKYEKSDLLINYIPSDMSFSGTSSVKKSERNRASQLLSKTTAYDHDNGKDHFLPSYFAWWAWLHFVILTIYFSIHKNEHSILFLPLGGW